MRRSLAAFTILLAAALPLGAASLPPTPQTGLGPFYPERDTPARDNDLAKVEGQPAPQGTLLEITGRILDTTGKPVAGARIVAWQTDAAGRYDHAREPKGRARDPGFQYWGETRSGKDGGYRFRTIVPGAYSSRPAHVHLRVQHASYRELATEMQLPGDEAADGDFVTTAEQRRLLVARVVEEGAAGGAVRAVHDIVLQAR
jgi:protocatechuate 3,4-dioxygenase beta subunit